MGGRVRQRRGRRRQPDQVDRRSPAAGPPNRVTRNYFDWRNRLVSTKDGDEGGTGENTDVNRQLTHVEYDNLDQVTAVERYDADTVSVTSHVRRAEQAVVVSLRRSRVENSFDELGNVYRTKTFSVDQSTGATGDALQVRRVVRQARQRHQGEVRQPGW